jgi:hypothetical protein
MANIITYKQILKVFENIAQRHYMLNSFFVGKDEDLQESTELSYPMLQVYPVNTNLTINEQGEYKTKQFSFDIKVLDLLLEDKTNRDDVISNCDRILSDVVNEINQNPYFINSNFALINDVGAEPLEEFEDDFLAGVSAQISFKSINTNTFCGLPLSPIDGIEFPGAISTGYTQITNYLTCETVTGCTTLQNYIYNEIQNIELDDYMPINGANLSGGSFNVSNAGVVDFIANGTIGTGNVGMWLNTFGIGSWALGNNINYFYSPPAANYLEVQTPSFRVGSSSTFFEVNTTQILLTRNTIVQSGYNLTSPLFQVASFGLGISNQIDTDTGIRFNAPDVLSLDTGGVDRLTVNAAGNIGIGMNAPTRRLQVSGVSFFEGAVIYNQQITTGSTSAVTINCALTNNAELTINQNTIITLSNFENGQHINISLINTGTFTCGFSNTIKWKGGAPTFTQNGIDVLTLLRINNVIYGSVIQNFI